MSFAQIGPPAGFPSSLLCPAQVLPPDPPGRDECPPPLTPALSALHPGYPVSSVWAGSLLNLSLDHRGAGVTPEPLRLGQRHSSLNARPVGSPTSRQHTTWKAAVPREKGDDRTDWGWGGGDAHPTVTVRFGPNVKDLDSSSALIIHSRGPRLPGPSSFPLGSQSNECNLAVMAHSGLCPGAESHVLQLYFSSKSGLFVLNSVVLKNSCLMFEIAKHKKQPNSSS